MTWRANWALVGIDVLATYGFTGGKDGVAGMSFSAWRAVLDCRCTRTWALWKSINPKTGEVMPNGEPGEICFSRLAGRTRHGGVAVSHSGDLTDGGMTMEPCPYCHRTMPRLVGNISRNSEIREMNLDKIKGTLVDFNELEHVACLMMPRTWAAWQVELRKHNDDPHGLDEIILHVQKTNGATKRN